MGGDQRAAEGRHTKGILFKYESCWERKRKCEPEHPVGIPVNRSEGLAVTLLFNSYARGTTTLSQLAAQLNDQGFRTRNTKRLPDSPGNFTAGSRLFTTDSMRVILHNAFYAGLVKHRDNLLPRALEFLLGKDVYDTVQAALKKNNGCSEALNPRPER